MVIGDSVTAVKGVGEKTAESFSRLGIFTVEDLVNYYPRSYVNYSNPKDIADVSCGAREAVFAVINSRVEVKKVRNMTLCSVYAKDFTGTIKLTWFNCPFLRNFFHIGESYVYVGDVTRKNGMLTMTQPEYYVKNKYMELLSVWQPVYSCVKGVTSKTIQKAVKNSEAVIKRMKDFLPEDIRKRNHLMSMSDALMNIHYPANEESLVAAIKRIAFNEFIGFLYNMDRNKESNSVNENHYVVNKDVQVAEFIESLPYKLTGGQKNAVDDVLSDMASDRIMNRLIEGDVGSGKTIVAAIALYAMALSGRQGVLMAPTEVLATQHYNDLVKLFEPYDIKVVLLCGSMTAKEKRLVCSDISEHRADIIIGTHALIQEKVTYDELGLVITDEQHRFGVRQRENLALKGYNPHVMVMSATPIPRTLAIIMYGDLDISVINELPAGRIPIKNCVVDYNYRETAHKFIGSEVKKGHQAYIVCPMVNQNEDMDDVANVIDYADDLKKYYGNAVSVAYLHGKMSGEEKRQILQDFYDGTIDVLVSTTVIEVGINNPNATVMMVENSERFGLAALHQLRGRVGRGSNQSYCIFLSGSKKEEIMDRINVLAESNDGFYIANEDLKRRGPGDFFGIRQSGEFMFKVGDIYNHADMLRLAQDVYREYKDELDVGRMGNAMTAQTVL